MRGLAATAVYSSHCRCLLQNILKPLNAEEVLCYSQIGTRVLINYHYYYYFLYKIEITAKENETARRL